MEKLPNLSNGKIDNLLTQNKQDRAKNAHKTVNQLPIEQHVYHVFFYNELTWKTIHKL